MYATRLLVALWLSRLILRPEKGNNNADYAHIMLISKCHSAQKMSIIGIFKVHASQCMVHNVHDRSLVILYVCLSMHGTWCALETSLKQFTIQKSFAGIFILVFARQRKDVKQHVSHFGVEVHETAIRLNR